MGWKVLRDHFEIRHLLQVTGSGIVIGTSFIPDIAVIDKATGKVNVSPTFPDFLQKNYPRLAAANRSEILLCLMEADVFERSIPVYTFEGATIHQCFCEVPGYPNLTHEGYLMYANCYSTDRGKVVQWAKESAKNELQWVQRSIASLKRDLVNAENELAHYQQVLEQLDQEEVSLV